MLARKGTGINNKFNTLIPECIAYRVCIAWVAAIAKGGVYLISVYLKGSVGMNAENKLVCEHIVAAVRSLDGTCVLAGDWKMEPTALAKSGFLGMTNGAVLAPELPTCHVFLLFHRK